MSDRWTTVPLSSLADSGGLFCDGDWIESKDQDPDGDVRLVQLADIGDGVFLDKSRRFMTSERAGELRCTYLQRGDVLISRMADPLGRACIFPGDARPCVTVVDVAVLRASPGTIDHAWLMNYINAPESRAALQRAASGTTRSRVSRTNLGTLSVRVPPLAEQQRIVDRLDAIFARSQQARDYLDTVPTLVSALRQSVLAAAFRGDLTKEWREAHPDAEPSAMSVARRPPPARPNRYGSRSEAIQVGEGALAVGNPATATPAGWSWVPLLDVARLESGHTPSREHPEYWDGEISWVSIPDARDHHGETIQSTRRCITQAGLDNSASRLLPKGAVFLCRTAASIGYTLTLGKPMATSQDFVAWICTESLNPTFLMRLLQAEKPSLLRFAKGSTHKTIYFPEILSFHICLPPIEEQSEIVQLLEANLALAESLEAAASRATLELPVLCETLLAQAFRGELVAQDPNEAPVTLPTAETPAPARRGRRARAT